MIFALSTDDLGLTAFPSEKEAVAHCEGIDVKQGGWQFYASDGRRLTARFTNPNVRGRFSVVSGSYVLEHLVVAACGHVHCGEGERGVRDLPGLTHAYVGDSRLV